MTLEQKTKFYEKLIGEMRGSLIEYARLQIRNDTETADIVQDVCLLAWAKLDTLSTHPNPRGWMMLVLKNYIRRYFAALADREETTEPLTDDVSELDSPFESSDVMLSFPSALTPQEMRIVDLKAQGYKHREIADKLGAQPGTIASAVSRIKAKIAKLLED